MDPKIMVIPCSAMNTMKCYHDFLNPFLTRSFRETVIGYKVVHIAISLAVIDSRKLICIIKADQTIRFFRKRRVCAVIFMTIPGILADVNTLGANDKHAIIKILIPARANNIFHTK